MNESTSPVSADDPSVATEGTEGLESVSYWSLMVAMFLSALNDNIFRWLVIGVGKEISNDIRAGDRLPPGWFSALFGELGDSWYIWLFGEHTKILAFGSACFLLPFLLFAGIAGYVADRFSKRHAIIGIKLAEVFIMIFGTIAVAYQSISLMLILLFFMGAQSALFGPCKLGSLPEIIRYRYLAKANGVMNMLTFIAIILGTLIGNILGALVNNYLSLGVMVSGAVVMGVAVVGWLASYGIRKLPAANPQRKPPYNLFGETAQDLKWLFSTRAIALVALGIAFYWSLGALAQMNIDRFGTHTLGIPPEEQWKIGPLLAMLGIGIGISSVIAGNLSVGRIELGMVPFGALGITFSGVILFIISWVYAGDGNGAYTATLFGLFLLGFTVGPFEVPLATYIQHHSPINQRGSILAASNFCSFSGMLLMAGVFWWLNSDDWWALGLEAGSIFLVVGLAAFPVAVFAMSIIPFSTARFFCYLVLRIFYRVRIFGSENVPEQGGVLLVSNHITWADAMLLHTFSPRPLRMIAYAGNLQFWPVKQLAQWRGTIFLELEKGPKAIVRALKEASEALKQGDAVLIFPEGGLSRTGQVLGFQRGLTKVIQGTDVPIVPVYLDELWGSIFSFSGGKFFWKWPQRWHHPVSLHFGEPMESVQEVYPVRQAVLELGAQAVKNRQHVTQLLPQRMIRRCRKYFRKPKIHDSTGQSMTGDQLLMRALIFTRLLGREVVAKGEQNVGVLLPPSAGGVLANAALALMKRTAINLNYTASSAVLNSCIQQAEIKHILTSRKFMDKMDLEIEGAELVYLEDLREKVTTADKAIGAFLAYTMPAFLLERVLGLHRIQPEDPMTVVFTSGSTGDPKGVVLTHLNVVANVASLNQVGDLRTDDTVIGVLPFFHSFGYTVTLWSMLTLDGQGAYHYSPLDARQVGKLSEQYKGTILLATPTFLRSYIRRCEPEQFQHLRLPIVGAEKLPEDVAKKFEQTFGVPVYEGYGMTEMSPLVSCNLPDVEVNGHVQKGNKPGTVGRPVPNVAAKVLDPETEEELPLGETGMLWVTGPNMMKGYLNRDDLTAEKIKDGWYCTGDLASLDDDGFITIKGRLSRFSKLGGEMVPHITIEDEIHRILGSEDEHKVVVTAVPDEKKGERLVVLHTPIEKSPDNIRKELSERGYSNLWIPSADSFVEIDEIPLLGSGKVALKEAREIALKKFSPEHAET